MGILNGDLITSNETRVQTCEHLLRDMIDDSAEICTVMYGSDISEEEVQELEKYVSDKFPVEVEIINGGQDIYSYIITVE